MRKGQDGSKAASVIGFIVLLFIFYILFLPPAERSELLQDNYTADDDDNGNGEYDDILLDETVGKLMPEGDNQFDHLIPNLYLAESTQATVLARENPFTIKKGLFGEDRKEMRFTIPDPENTENVMVSFQALVRKGTLNVALNGMPIFQSPIPVQNPAPIPLPKSLLQEVNTITFYATGGWLQSKKYSLMDIKVIGDITDVKKQEATNTFKMSEMEYDHLDDSYLDFYPICDQAYVGIMTIILNGKVIYSAVPACDSVNRQEIFKDDLREGKNTLIFQISRGAFRVEQIRIRNIVEEMKSYVAYFETEEDLWDDILDGDADIELYIEFVNDIRRKQAELNINGRLLTLDQKDREYERDITSLIREGNNYIEITPITELDIPRLKVRVE